MKAAVSAPLVLLPADPSQVVVKLFSPEDTPLRSLEKRPPVDDPYAAR